MAECSHEVFFCTVDITRMKDTGQFMADVRVVCNQCKMPFRFLGLPAGLDFNGAAVSVDALEARLAIAPRDQVASEIEGTLGPFAQPKGDGNDCHCAP